MANEVQITISAVDKTKQAIGGIGKSLETMGKVALGIGVAGLAALGAGLAYSVKEAMEAQEVMAQLEAVLKATGGVAGITAKDASDLANSLMKVTRFTDETILSAETMLLQFKGINKDVFPQTTELALDLATRLGTDASSAARMLGKALETPGEGLLRLKAAGVAFDDAQIEMIKGMAEAGDMAGAQKMILDELSKSIGGAARASGKTFAGQLDILKNSLSNVAEAVGTAILPLLQSLMDRVIVPMIPYIVAFGDAIAALVNEFMRGYEAGGLINGIMEVLDNVLGEELINSIWDVIDGITAIATKIGEFITTILVPFVQDHLKEFKGALIAIGAVLAAGAIIAGIVAIAGVIASLFNPITLIIGIVALLGAAWAGNWGGIQEKTQAVIEWLKPYIQAFLDAIRAWWAAHGEQVIATVTALWEGAKAAFSAAFEFLKAAVTTFLAAIKAFWDAHGEQIKATVQAIWDGIKAIWEAFKAAYETAMELFHLAQEGKWREFGEKLREVWDAAWEKLKEVVKLAWEKIKEYIATAIDNIVTAFKNTDWKAVGTGIIQGIIDGIKAGWNWLRDAAKAAAKAALDAAKGFLGIDSPSKVFMDVGKNMMTGMAMGIAGYSGIPSAAMVGATSGIVNNTWSLTINEAGKRGSVVNDFALLKALARA